MTRFDHRARVPCIIDEHNGKEGGVGVKENEEIL